MSLENDLSRRRFFQAGLLGCAAAATVPAAAAPEAAGKIAAFEPDGMTIQAREKGMKSGKAAARSLVEKYRARIEEIDRQGPAINSVIELNPDALEIADA